MANYYPKDYTARDFPYLSHVSPQTMDLIHEKILQLLVIGKKYRDSSYTAKRLAADLQTNTRYVSAVINVRFHTNFTSLVNKYRVEEAMVILRDSRYKELTVEQVGDKVGFTSRQTFYAAFNRINGCSPREYQVRTLENEEAGTAPKD